MNGDTGSAGEARHPVARSERLAARLILATLFAGSLLILIFAAANAQPEQSSAGPEPVAIATDGK
jgi:hypothetical protein